MMSMIDCIARGEVAKIVTGSQFYTTSLPYPIYTQMRYKLDTPSIQSLQVQPNTVLRLEVKLDIGCRG